jgi:hypothetical protein
MSGRRLLAPLLLALSFPALSFCTTVYVGLITFDVLIPAGAGPGVNVFNISNFTGDPGSGGFALPPDFPVFTGLTFLSCSLTLDDGVSPFVVPLGDLGPGSLSPTTPVEFPDFSTFLSATFTASLSQTTFLLSNTSSFTANSSTITVQLLPSSGPTLQAGTDFALIGVSDQVASIPEPQTWVLTFLGLAACIAASRRKVLN